MLAVLEALQLHTNRQLFKWSDTCSVNQDQEYNHERNAAYWATRPVLVTKRSLEIGMQTWLHPLKLVPGCLLLFSW